MATIDERIKKHKAEADRLEKEKNLRKQRDDANAELRKLRTPKKK